MLERPEMIKKFHDFAKELSSSDLIVIIECCIKIMARKKTIHISDAKAMMLLLHEVNEDD